MTHSDFNNVNLQQQVWWGLNFYKVEGINRISGKLLLSRIDLHKEIQVTNWLRYQDVKLVTPR